MQQAVDPQLAELIRTGGVRLQDFGLRTIEIDGSFDELLEKAPPPRAKQLLSIGELMSWLEREAERQRIRIHTLGAKDPAGAKLLSNNFGEVRRILDSFEESYEEWRKGRGFPRPKYLEQCKVKLEELRDWLEGEHGVQRAEIERMMQHSSEANWLEAMRRRLGCFRFAKMIIESLIDAELHYRHRGQWPVPGIFRAMRPVT